MGCTVCNGTSLSCPSEYEGARRTPSLSPHPPVIGFIMGKGGGEIVMVCAVHPHIQKGRTVKCHCIRYIPSHLFPPPYSNWCYCRTVKRQPSPRARIARYRDLPPGSPVPDWTSAQDVGGGEIVMVCAVHPHIQKGRTVKCHCRRYIPSHLFPHPLPTSCALVQSGTGLPGGRSRYRAMRARGECCRLTVRQ